MEKAAIKNRVLELAEKFTQEKINGNETVDLINSYNMNSVDVLELLLSFETEFKFEFDDEELHESMLRDVDKLVAYIDAKVNG